MIGSSEIANNEERKLHAFPMWVVDTQPLRRNIYMFHTISESLKRDLQPITAR
jgi:hypothetical protein